MYTYMYIKFERTLQKIYLLLPTDVKRIEWYGFNNNLLMMHSSNMRVFFLNCSIACNCTLAPSAVTFLFLLDHIERHFNFRFWFRATTLKFLQWNMSDATPISFSGYICRHNSKYLVKVPSDVTI